jgi:hypothetical protein
LLLYRHNATQKKTVGIAVAHGQKLDTIPFNRRTAIKLNRPRDLDRAVEPGLNRQCASRISSNSSAL